VTIGKEEGEEWRKGRWKEERNGMKEGGEEGEERNGMKEGGEEEEERNSMKEGGEGERRVMEEGRRGR
jgi:hypothetical protein